MTVVVPTGALVAKVSSVEQFDLRLVLHGEGYRDAETHASSWLPATGAATYRPTTTPT